jgi:hypothetical protein
MAQPLGFPARADRALEQSLQRLSHDLRELRIEFERFFSGAEAVPPEELRGRVQVQLRELRQRNLGLADNFRLGSLEAQFNAYNELYNRRLREREEGRHVAPRPAAPAVAPAYDAEAGIAVDERPSRDALAALFQRLYPTADRAARVDFESFCALVAAQGEQIRQRSGCARVLFRVAEEEGKLKLKAKPLAG